jgi:hypothetical protein
MLAAAAFALAAPFGGFLLLMRRPSLDVHWDHQPAHFWIVLSSAVLSAALAYGTGSAALRRGDARVLMVSLVFLASALFLGLHASRRPAYCCRSATRASWWRRRWASRSGRSSRRSPRSTSRAIGRCAACVAGGALGSGCWSSRRRGGTATLTKLPPLHGTSVPERADGILTALAVPAVVLYAFSATRYVALWRRRPSLMLLSMLSAFVLLAEAMVAVVFARDWALSWWEWHLLLLAAFGLVAMGARIQWHEERFADLYLDDTVSGTREVSVLFADVQGFTAFSEAHDPVEVALMLNAYFEVAVPPVCGSTAATSTASSAMR